MKKVRIYLDTSVINFLFADDAPEKRDVTRKFFERHITRYEAFISAVVLDEINRTKVPAKRNRLLEATFKYGLKQLANVNKERRVLAINHQKGYFYPLRITTPLEVMGDE